MAGKGGPWGNAPHNDNDPSVQELDELIRKSQEKLRGMFGGGGGGGDINNKRLIILGIIAVVFLWLGSGLYRVNSDQLGIVLRFGEFHHVTGPGLNYKLPYPIETVQRPSVTSVNKVEVGYRNIAGSNRNSGRTVNEESLMLTADRNIIDINFEVQWKIDATAPQDFLFNVRDPELTVKPVAESAMREVIGRNNLTEILTTAQSEIAEETKEIMQQMLDNYEAGLEVIAVNLNRPDVPAPVIDEFQDVKRAEQDKETAESVAEGYSNEIIPRAKGEAEQMKQQALAYKNKVIADAEGDAARFLSVYNEYKLARDVTKKRIYLETMETILDGMDKIIIDQQNGQGVLPYLPLKTLQSRGSE